MVAVKDIGMKLIKTYTGVEFTPMFELIDEDIVEYASPTKPNHSLIYGLQFFKKDNNVFVSDGNIVSETAINLIENPDKYNDRQSIRIRLSARYAKELYVYAYSGGVNVPI